MFVRCEKCSKIYNDFDHLTCCPHDGFAPSLDYDRLVSEGKAPRYDRRVSQELINDPSISSFR